MSQIKEMFEKIPAAFKPEAAKGMNSVFQWEITGEGGGNWYITVNDGKCEVKEGIHPSPNVTMSMNVATYTAMINKQLNPMQAFMTGKLRVSGNIMMAQKFPQLFGL